MWLPPSEVCDEGDDGDVLLPACGLTVRIKSKVRTANNAL